jgi:hypothetical protein
MKNSNWNLRLLLQNEVGWKYWVVGLDCWGLGMCAVHWIFGRMPHVILIAKLMMGGNKIRIVNFVSVILL